MRLKRRRPEPAEASDPFQAELAATRYLARREYAAHELAERLRERGFAEEAVAVALENLKSAGLQNDRRFTEAFVSSRVGRGHGPVRIASELRRRGIPDDDIGVVLDEAADWGSLAGAVRKRRFGAAAPRGWAAKAKQARFLEQRGFAHDHIRAALGDDTDR